MEREKFIHGVLEAIGSITREFNTRERYPFNHHALGRPHINVLFLLSQRQYTIKELSARLHVTSGAVTQFIDNLEQKKLVQRIENPNDKRSRLVRLTSGSEHEIRMFRKEYFRAIAGHFEELSDNELKKLFQILQKIKGE